MDDAKDSSGSAGAFVTTRWTRVLQARGTTPEAQAALGELCQAYWMPVFRFLRRQGRNEEAARDLTQEFFARLLEKHGLDSLERGRGRFRSFLLGAVKHFLADVRDGERAAKRGGGRAIESLDASSDTSTDHPFAELAAPPPDTFFDRHWALTLMERGLTTLESEFAAEGKADQFALLKPWLAGDINALPQAEVARRLGLNEGTVKVAVHRLRKRFRELIRAEISQTVADPSQVDAELSYLVEVLSA